MSRVKAFFLQKPLNFLLILLPLAVAAELLGWSPLWVFIISAAGIIPLAGLIGVSTEAIASHTGPRVGGLLNATLGNAAEMIIALVAIRAGLLDLVKASITGSILGNLLLVMGLSMVYGGIRNGLQTFDRRQASNNSILLLLVVIALAIPSLFSHSIGEVTSMSVEVLSLGVASVMVVLYILGLIFVFSQPAARNPLGHEPTGLPPVQAHLSVKTAILILAAATLGVVVLSEILVGAVEHVTASLGLSEFFLGIVLIPIIGNVAEHLVAVTVAGKNNMDLSIEIAVSSSIQIALFVAPLLVFISLAMGNPLNLVFNSFELLALVAAVWIASVVSGDGESNWLEGAALLAVYLILAIGFFLLPAAQL